MSESSAVIPPALVEFTKRGARMFRNFVGGAWVGRGARKADGTVILKGARQVVAGLGTGSSDLIGWTPHLITADDVGRQVAIFTAAECKTLAYKTITDDQRNFLTQVVKAGGLGYVVREAEGGITVEPWKVLDKV